MKFKNWPETQQAFLPDSAELKVIGQITATNINGVPTLLITPNPELLQKVCVALDIEWKAFAHQAATVTIVTR